MQRTISLDRLARAHHGVVTREQCRDLGVPGGTIDDWVACGRFEPLHRGVYRLAGTVRTSEQSAYAAVAAGGVCLASHRSAARLWGLLDDDEVEVSIPAGRKRSLRGVVVHRSSDFWKATPSRKNMIPVTNPLRTLVDLGAVVDRFTLTAAVELAITRRLVTIPGLESEWEGLAGRGRPGCADLRRVLDDLALGADRPESLLETRMARLLRRAGLRRPRFQYEIRVGGRPIGRVDFAYPEARLVVEVDGWSVHSTPTALQRDLARQNALIQAGWTVLRFTWTDVVRRPEAVAAAIRRSLEP